MNTEYKWENAHDWLMFRLLTLSEERILEYARLMARHIDPDDIQEIFQDDMEYDGYFEAVA